MPSLGDFAEEQDSGDEVSIPGRLWQSWVFEFRWRGRQYRWAWRFTWDNFVLWQTRGWSLGPISCYWGRWRDHYWDRCPVCGELKYSAEHCTHLENLDKENKARAGGAP